MLEGLLGYVGGGDDDDGDSAEFQGDEGAVLG